MLEEWTAILSQLWEAYGKELEPERMKLYKRQLGIIPLGLLDLAIGRAIREHKFNSVPTVGDVWDAVRIELRKAGIYTETMSLEDALETWKDRKYAQAVHVFVL